mmetsp:Transcript_21589/g.39340  ORF Transcript_21589/g.39340 Transcript_21589/m.39340 type:complete len:190 (+) Transcript_21589:257-826(+)
MIMMKIMEHGSAAGGPTIFGSVALPLDSKHTQGAQIPMPIFDEGLNMKGVVRVAACWSSSFPRRVKVTLQGVQDLPESADGQGWSEVSCRVLTQSGLSQATPSKCAVMAGCADLKSVGLDQLEMQDEQDRLTVEVLLYGAGINNGQGVVFGRADITLPSDGPAKDEAVAIAGMEEARPAIVHLRTSWVE